MIETIASLVETGFIIQSFSWQTRYGSKTCHEKMMLEVLRAAIHTAAETLYDVQLKLPVD